MPGDNMSSQIVEQGTVVRGQPGTDRQSCAFPQVALLPGGRWLVACRAAPTKAATSSQSVLSSFSDDKGKTWSVPDRPFVPPDLNGVAGRFRAAGFTAVGGSRLLATLLWVDCSDPSLPYFNKETEGLLDSRILFAESADDGRTWSEPVLMDTSPFTVPTPITGPVLRFPDGELICQFETNKPYLDTAKWTHSSVMMFSRDGGRTWPRYSVVTRHSTIFYWDQRPQILRAGRVLDLFWTYDNLNARYLNIHARESADRGRTWSELWDTGVPGQPAPVVELPDGRLVMVYVDRTTAPAIRGRLSRDGGRTWPADTQFSIYESDLGTQTRAKAAMADAWSEMGKFSVGLPATAALPDGDVLIVYYAGPATDQTSVEWARLRL
jgi:hypothetical protein